MKVIYKYQFEIADWIEIEMHEGAEILCVKTQHCVPVMWVVCDAYNDKETRSFKIVGTGQHVDTDYLNYIGTIFQRDEYLVFHVFEVIK